ncbi:hypothetical protein [Cryobacterium sp. Y29]|uniref:hypothetical protein n=1 Tax=Cryobacterium sp. Y29 TaxID=2048285 RepID=UPI0011B0D2E5|nr:hypothetical protein [Cryobacterium sp. Y29]
MDDTQPSPYPTSRYTAAELKLTVEERLAQTIAGAAGRSLRIVDATFTASPSVWFDEDKVSLDDVLDLAHAMEAPFISVEPLVFNLEEFLEDDEDDDAVDLAALPKKLQALNTHNGALSGLFIRWVHDGSVYLYMIEASWFTTASDLRNTWRAKEEDDRGDNLTARLARAAELTEELEKMEAFRRTPPRTRKMKAAKLIAPLRQPSDDDTLINHAIRVAAENAALNSQLKFQEISENLTEVATDLAATERWKNAHQAPAKLSVARDFLIQLSGGYSPTEAFAKELRDTARNSQPVMLLGRRG